MIIKLEKDIVKMYNNKEWKYIKKVVYKWNLEI